MSNPPNGFVIWLVSILCLLFSAPDFALGAEDLVWMSHVVVGPDSTPTITVPPDFRENRLEVLEIHNVGTVLVSGIHIHEPTRNWSRPGSILRTALADAETLTDREKVLSLFQYVVDHLESEAYRSRWDCYDLWKAFNCYGFGHCEFHSRVFSGLLRMAGLRSVQVNVSPPEDSRHTVPHTMVEVFYDGDWHLFDPQGRVFYLEGDNRTIASWNELMQHPEWVKRTHPIGPSFENLDHRMWFVQKTRIWRDEKTVRILPTPTEATATLHLFPGEQIAFFREGGKAYIDNLTSYPPPQVPHSRMLLMTRLPDVQNRWDRARWLGPFKTNRAGDLFLMPRKQGNCMIPVDVVYPIVDATVDVSFRIDGENGEFRVSVARNPLQHRKIQVVRTWKSPGEYRVHLPLKSFVEDWNNPFATYHYRVYLEGTTGKHTTVSIRSVHIRTEGQVATRSLPRPNADRWILSARAGSDCILTLRVESSKQTFPPVPVLDPPVVQPDGHGGVSFSWTEDSVGEGRARAFDLQISEDPRMRWNLFPITNTRQDWSKTHWTAARDLFPATGTLYWRVRAIGQEGVQSGWSRIGRIRLAQ